MRRLLKQTGGLSRNPNSTKYYVSSCSPEWIHIEKELKIAHDMRDIDIQKSQILIGTMLSNDIVVKIGDSNDLTNEYTIAQQIKKFKGFVKFLCFFTCHDDFREFFKGQRIHLCKSLGTTMKVIIMPFYPLGSIASYRWSKDNMNILHSCLYIACICYIDAYKEKGFIHNDFHAANILLKETKQSNLVFSGNIITRLYGIRPWIMDFEKSQIDTHTKKGYEDFKYDLSKLFFMLPTMVKEIDRATILNVPTYLQSINDICSDSSRNKLLEVIVKNVQVHSNPNQIS
jgi:serine/threonine protein kinase